MTARARKHGGAGCWGGLLFGIGVWVLLLPGSAGADVLANTIARIKPSIVGVGTVERTRRPPIVLRGTGFAVADGRHVLTNAHVVSVNLDGKDREFLAVFSGEGPQAQVRQARVVARDKVHDVALLKISGAPLPSMKIGDAGRVREGDRYAFTGFPIGMVLGLYPVTHRGIVSSITPVAVPANTTRSLDSLVIKRLKHPYKVFQLDATAYPGNSGSPLYEVGTGRVVGIVNKVFVKGSKENALSKPSGISYAIPVTYAKALLDKAGVKY